MKLSRQEAAQILKKINNWVTKTSFTPDIIKALEMAIDVLDSDGVKLIIKHDILHSQDVYYSITECCKIGPITNENYCPKCGKKIIK